MALAAKPAAAAARAGLDRNPSFHEATAKSASALEPAPAYDAVLDLTAAGLKPYDPMAAAKELAGASGTELLFQVRAARVSRRGYTQCPFRRHCGQRWGEAGRRGRGRRLRAARATWLSGVLHAC